MMTAGVTRSKGRLQDVSGALAAVRGTTAIEFAFVAPVFLALCIGGMYMCMMLWTMGSMQNAAEQAARCWAVATTVCTSASSAQTYASNNYHGVGTPTFTATKTTCGYQVASSLSYSWDLGLNALTVPLNTTACFP